MKKIIFGLLTFVFMFSVSAEVTVPSYVGQSICKYNAYDLNGKLLFDYNLEIFQDTNNNLYIAINNKEIKNYNIDGYYINKNGSEETSFKLNDFFGINNRLLEFSVPYEGGFYDAKNRPIINCPSAATGLYDPGLYLVCNSVDEKEENIKASCDIYINSENDEYYFNITTKIENLEEFVPGIPGEEIIDTPIEDEKIDTTLNDKIFAYDNPIYQEGYFCTTTSSIWQLVGYLFTVIRILIPLIIIGLAIYDLTKVVISSERDSLNKAIKILIKRIIIGFVIFFIPAIVNAVMYLIDVNDTYTKKVDICKDCLVSPTGDSCKNAKIAAQDALKKKYN